MRCLSLERCVPKCIKLMIFAICSLSQTPDTRFLDFAGSAFDSVLGGLEKGVWFIGLVSYVYICSFIKPRNLIK